MSKQDKTTNTKAPKIKKARNYNGIIGVLLLFVVASIAYTTTVIAMGTEGYVPLILAAPQAIFGVVVLFKQFTK